MFEFNEQQRMVQTMVRQWAERELAPALDDLESEKVPPYELMRKFRDTFGLNGVVKSSFKKMIAREKERLASGSASTPPGTKAVAGGGATFDGAIEGASDGDGDGAADDPTRDPSYGSIMAIELSRWSPGFVMAMG